MDGRTDERTAPHVAKSRFGIAELSAKKIWLCPASGIHPDPQRRVIAGFYESFYETPPNIYTAKEFIRGGGCKPRPLYIQLEEAAMN